MPSLAFLTYVDGFGAGTRRQRPAADAPVLPATRVVAYPAPSAGAVGLGLIVVVALLLAAAVFLLGGVRPSTTAAACAPSVSSAPLGSMPVSSALSGTAPSCTP